jgi:putative ABC transport system permease protein
MFGNYLMAALRNLARNRLYAGINIVGLAVGFAAAILIALYVRDELTFDRFIPDAAHIYNVYTVFPQSGRTPLVIDRTAGDLAAAFRLDFPALPAIGQLMLYAGKFRHSDVEAVESLYWADADIFAALPLPVFAGNLTTALQGPDSVVLTRRMARKYFGHDNPIGQTIELRVTSVPQPFTVTAVLQDIPSNTSLRAEIFVSGASAESPLRHEDVPGLGFPCDVHILIHVPTGYPIERLRRASAAFLLRHKSQDAGMAPVHLDFQPLTDIHLTPTELGDFRPPSNPVMVYALGVVGILIVLVACINFVNLMTACALERSVEVGIRKVSGALRRDLVKQFLGESLLYALLGLLLGLAIVELLLPALNALVDRSITFHYWADLRLSSVLVSLAVAVGVLAGVYPALVLSSFRPMTALKHAAHLAGSGLVRQVLVAIQFAVLVVLLIATGVIYRQTSYALSKTLPLNKENVMMISIVPTNGPLPDTSAYADAIRSLSAVSGVAQSSALAMGFGQEAEPVVLPNGSKVIVNHAAIDFGFFEFYGLKPLAGRFFQRTRGADGVSADPKAPWHPPIVVNERALRLLGFASPQSAIGKSITLTEVAAAPGPSEIIGVVPDFSFKSVRNVVDSMIYFVDGTQRQIVSVRLKGDDIPTTVAAIDKIGKDLSIPRSGWDFLPQYLRGLYIDVVRQSNMLAIFAGVAAFIACLGLFGLSVYSAEQRTKEIGIRKTMGATRLDIVKRLLWQFSKPVIWANLIAWPIAGITMSRWLQGFAYHINLEPWLFLSATLLALMIALLTVSGHAILVARAKPATALRYE